MAVEIKRADPLKKVANAENIREHIAVMQDPEESDMIRQGACSWLVGALKVMTRDEKQGAAVDFIVDSINEYRRA